MRGIFILNEIWAQDKTYFGRNFAWLKHFTYLLSRYWLVTISSTFFRGIKLEKCVIH
jgi:hypothetical protein